MAAPVHREPNYMAIWIWLAVLTVIEIGVIYLPLAKMVVAILLIGLALSKATLVAAYFMHLRFERLTLAIIAITPLLICTLLVFALVPDLSAVPHRTTTTQEAKPAH
jgi:cytochrome c oxidase subunit 4